MQNLIKILKVISILVPNSRINLLKLSRVISWRFSDPFHYSKTFTNTEIERNVSAGWKKNLVYGYNFILEW